MRLLYFIFFSLGLPLVLQATASNNECSRKPLKRCRISSYSKNVSDHQQKRIKKSKWSNILPAESSNTQHSSSDVKNDHTSKSRRLKLQKNTSRASKLPAKVKSN